MESAPLPTLLGNNAASLVKEAAKRRDNHDVEEHVEAMCSVNSTASAARDMATNQELSFEELFQRVQTGNKLDNISIQASELTESQRTSLILRGTRLRTVLTGFGKYLKNNRASESTFECCSQPIQFIDEFLSHAWATNRWLKTLALLYNYNFVAAVIAYSVTAAIVFAACFYIRCSQQDISEGDFKVASAFAMMLTPTLVFLIVFIFGINRYGHGGGPVVFFDKLCIHQTNEDLKFLAISSLETFVRKSKRLVLLYDGVTYERLWCAFETAMFAHDQEYKTSEIHFVPIATSILVLSLSIMNMYFPLILFPIIDALVDEPADTFFAPFTVKVAFANFIAQAVCPVLMPDLYRKRCEDTQKLVHNLTSFSVRQTKCSDERDRHTVNDRIVETWGSLADFDAFMREDVRKRVTEMMYYTPCIGPRNILPLAMPEIVFTFWMGLNSPSYSMTEIAIGAFAHGLVIRPICIACGDKFAEAICQALPANARWLRTGSISLLVSASWVLHNFVHCSIWVWSYKLSASYGWKEAGCLLFLPFLLTEVALLFRFHLIAKEGDGTLFVRWTLADTLYFVYWIGLAIMILWEASRTSTGAYE
jgi:hypothetical protein